MANKKQKNRQRQIGKTKPEKKPLIPAKHKNAFWTIIFLIIMLIFFIVNNTGNEPEQGPYPPGYSTPHIKSDTLNLR
jgi:hypothetical protein